MKKRVNRRDFLKFSPFAAFSLLGFSEGLDQISRFFKIKSPQEINNLKILLTLSEFEDFQFANPNTQGRVVHEYIFLRESPSSQSQIIKTYWRDSILPINNATVSEDDESHNPVWYRIADEGFVHSGALQPVATILNQPELNVPIGGNIAEVTVPFTDARWKPGSDQRVVYRFYFSTTHWVIGVEYDSLGNPWYIILDDKWEFIFYAPAEHLRLIPENELKPISPDVPSILKRLVVHLPDQILVAYEGEKIVFMARIASGAVFSDGNYTTPTGRHITFHKRPSRHMAAGNLAFNGYDLPGVPWICYITESGVAFHGTYWHNDYGRPRSHGCINLSPQAAKWVYQWTIPIVPAREKSAYETFGTAVEIYD